GLDLMLMNPMTLESGTLGGRRIESWFPKSKLKRLIKSSPLLTGSSRRDLRPPRTSVISRLMESWPGPLERLFWTHQKPEFRGSVLVLWGGLDRLNSPYGAHEFLNSYRDIEYFENENCGHWLHLEDPNWVSEKMKS